MKTAMQELVEKMSKDQVSFTDWFIDNYELFIEKEKKQIIEAHFEGWGDAYDYLKDIYSAPRQAEDYYNETYQKI